MSGCENKTFEPFFFFFLDIGVFWWFLLSEWPGAHVRRKFLWWIYISKSTNSCCLCIQFSAGTYVEQVMYGTKCWLPHSGVHWNGSMLHWTLSRSLSSLWSSCVHTRDILHDQTIKSMIPLCILKWNRLQKWYQVIILILSIRLSDLLRKCFR